MHMLSKKYPSPGELETLRRSRNPITVVTAHGEVQTNEEAQEKAHGEAWDPAKDVYKLKKEEKVTFYYPAEVGVLPALSSKKPEEREVGIDTILISS